MCLTSVKHVSFLIFVILHLLLIDMIHLIYSFAHKWCYLELFCCIFSENLVAWTKNGTIEQNIESVTYSLSIKSPVLDHSQEPQHLIPVPQSWKWAKLMSHSRSQRQKVVPAHTSYLSQAPQACENKFCPV